jgi:hypothetical protein
MTITDLTNTIGVDSPALHHYITREVSIVRQMSYFTGLVQAGSNYLANVGENGHVSDAHNQTRLELEQNANLPSQLRL